MDVLIKNHWEKKLLFHVSVFFFQLGDPHETLYFTGPELLFHFSSFCIFGKTWTKNDSKIRCRKNIRKLAQLRPKITQKSIKIEVDAPGNLKKCKKKLVFWRSKKTSKKRVEKTSRFSPYDILLMHSQFRSRPPPPSNSLPQRPDGPRKQRKGAHARFP